jgi:epoxyqueuosine reductase
MKKLLLHTCCAPCFSYPYNILSGTFDITAFFFNPNITSSEEYSIRFNELAAYSRKNGFTLMQGEYSVRDWCVRVSPLRFSGEKGERCAECFRIRLEETFLKAALLNYDSVSTVLSISPHKDSALINSIGKELQKMFDIEFLEADFKKDDGFKKAAVLARENNFYRQNYCGCVYSKLERDKTSRWHEMIRK